MNLQAFLFCLTLLLSSSYSASSSSSLVSCTKSSYNSPDRSRTLPEQYLEKLSGFYVTDNAPREYNVSDNLAFSFEGVSETDEQGLVCINASLILYTKSKDDSRLVNSEAAVFAHLTLDGVWSEPRGKLRLVGNGVKMIAGSREYQQVSVSLELYNLYNSTNLTSLITGNLESLVDPDCFGPVSFVLFPTMSYEYKMVLQALSEEGRTVDPPSFSPIASLRSIFPYHPLTLKHSSYTSPPGEPRRKLPRIAQLTRILCDELSHSMRFLIIFGEIFTRRPRTLDPKSTLLGEAVWDSRNDQLYIVACRFLNATDSWAKARVGDCSMRMSVRFSETWTLGNTSTLSGRLWSTETTVSETEIELSENYYDGIAPTKKYEYTKLDIAKQWCRETKRLKRKNGATYPKAISATTRFNIFTVKGSNNGISKGYAQPVAIENELYFSRPDRKSLFGKNPVNVSYLISLYNVSLDSNSTFDISAEGSYDNSTGRLCMIGCRKIGLSITIDCEIRVNFQFPERKSKLRESFITGRIESRRRKTDQLYFDALTLSLSADFIEPIPVADSETGLLLVSNLLAVVFAALQIAHLRKNPNLSPFVAAAMLLNLILSTSFHMRDSLLETSERLEIAAMVLLLCTYSWIFRLVWAAKWRHENPHALWLAEIGALPIFSGAVFLVVFFADAWRSCSEILLSFFLVPQILLNVVRDSREEALSRYFYVGTSFATLLPRAAPDLYRAADMEYGIWARWEVKAMISYRSLVFVGIVYLQHKFGGRCIVPFRFRKFKI